MITNLFLGFTLLGAEWVLILLIILSIVSIALIFERRNYFKKVKRELDDKITQALKPLGHSERVSRGDYMVQSLVAEARLGAEQRLSWLATIGANAPFVGLFGTVLGIIRAFADLSKIGTQGSNVVSAGISEALVATAVGLFVAIPAVVAYNYFQRQVKDMVLRAERTKNALLGQG